MDRPSGKFVLRLSPELHHNLKREAQRMEISLNQLCQNILSAHYDVTEFSGPGNRVENGKITSSILSGLKEHGLSVEGILLFGSVARGEHTEKSDVDLLLVLDCHAVLNRSLYEIWDKDIASQLPSHVSPHFARFPHSISDVGGLWYEAALDGRILFESGSRLRQLLQRLREQMAQGKLVRRQTYGHPYWIKKQGT